MTIRDKIKQLQSIDVDAIVDSAIVENEEEILNANRDQMYERGQIDVQRPDYKGKYAASTMRQKRRTARFPKTDFITLKWMGEFHDSLKLFIFKDFIAIRAMDIKWGLYISEDDRFKNALGLTKDSLSAIRDKIKVSFLNTFRNELS